MAFKRIELSFNEKDCTIKQIRTVYEITSKFKFSSARLVHHNVNVQSRLYFPGGETVTGITESVTMIRVHRDRNLEARQRIALSDNQVCNSIVQPDVLTYEL